MENNDYVHIQLVNCNGDIYDSIISGEFELLQNDNVSHIICLN